MIFRRTEAPAAHSRGRIWALRGLLTLGGTALAVGLGASAAQADDDERGLLGGVLPSAVTETVEDVTESLDPLIDPVRDLAGPVTEPVQEATEPVTDELSGVVQEVVEPVTTAVEPITEPVDRVVSEVANPVREVVEPVTDTVTEVSDGVGQVLRPATDGLQPVTDGAGGVVEDVLEMVSGPAEGSQKPDGDDTGRDEAGGSGPGENGAPAAEAASDERSSAGQHGTDVAPDPGADVLPERDAADNHDAARHGPAALSVTSDRSATAGAATELARAALAGANLETGVGEHRTTAPQPVAPVPATPEGSAHGVSGSTSTPRTAEAVDGALPIPGPGLALLGAVSEPDGGPHPAHHDIPVAPD